MTVIILAISVFFEEVRFSSNNDDYFREDADIITRFAYDSRLDIYCRICRSYSHTSSVVPQPSSKYKYYIQTPEKKTI
ncbi:MAG TPA: hypothetical protein VIP70_04320 [Nitrososphaeraceae archaeon]